MVDPTKTSWNYVWVRDRAGNEYVCKTESLKDPKKLPEKELSECLEDASRAVPLGD